MVFGLSLEFLTKVSRQPVVGQKSGMLKLEYDCVPNGTFGKLLPGGSYLFMKYCVLSKKNENVSLCL